MTKEMTGEELADEYQKLMNQDPGDRSDKQDRLFNALDAKGFSISYVAMNWDDAEAIAERNGFTDVGLLIKTIPVYDENLKVVK